MAALAHQGAVAGVDSVQHALGVEHAPNALAGAVSFDGDHDHHAPADADKDHGRPDDRVRSHHHAGEATVLMALEAERLAALILATGTALDMPPTDEPESWTSARLERPPKPLSI
jgi:hypothetical protein